MSVNKLPHPFSKRWPDARDQAVVAALRKIILRQKIRLFPYQKPFLFPPKPYKRADLRFVMLQGATRIGKSMIMGIRGAVTPLVPGYVTRLYGFEHENCEREFRHIHRLLLDANNPNAMVHQYPQLAEHLDSGFNANPDNGRLVMKWPWGSEIRSMSWKSKSQWRGEAVDLGIICEPGLFPDGRVYTAEIRNRLTDRRGTCYCSGTADNPWMRALHETAHDHDTRPDIMCICEIPQWANPTLNLTAEDIRLMRDEMTPRDYAVNVLGTWENLDNIAYERFGRDYIRTVDMATWRKLKAVPPNWDHFLCIDTGKHASCGQYIIAPDGRMLMIDEWTNYTYRGGQVKPSLIDDRGFKSWFADIVQSVQNDLGPYRNRPAVWGDPSSQFKQDVNDLGYGFVDAVNAHDYGVNAFNEYLAKRKFMIVRPTDRQPFLCEYELANVRWADSPSGISGRHRLHKGDDNDHSADQVRYAAASRPLGDEVVRDIKPTVVQDDIENMGRANSDANVDDVMGYFY